MPRKPSRAAPVLLVPGWQGSEAGHWQRWLVEQLRANDREARLLDLPEIDAPALDPWLASLRHELKTLPDDGFDVLCHSLGSLLWLQRTAGAEDSPRPARVVLVAPPSPHIDIADVAEFVPPPLDVDAVRRAAGGTVLVASDNDPYCPETAAIAYGRPLLMPTTVIAGGAHLNTAAGFGPWPAALAWCNHDNLAFTV